ncbi:MAG TPA: imidazole glycerol phosphate synthase subunit HisH [Pyrinomonadaceae bacterium]|nr:imidazole glycerol phosphate synthase subunit HisH [Pyrinomonadaceae bacterium]
MKVAIIDYGVGNLRSVEKAFAATGCEAVVSGDENELRRAERLVLPGVGAFGACMKALKERGFDRLVYERAREGTPLLGVCVGMQMLFEESDEFGSTRGLGLLKGKVRRFSDALVVPQVGWNRIHQARPHALFEGVGDGAFCYFVHSYYCEPVDETVIAGETEYGGRYASVVTKENVCGVQFHPEKSQDVGLRMLKNFGTRMNTDFYLDQR